jgi:membrane protease YdiL (CAAX protease family)
MLRRFLVLSSLLVSPAFVALALDGANATRSSAPTIPWVAVAIISWVLCYQKRKNPVGGWLLYFFIQLFTGLLYSQVSLLMSATTYGPSNWHEPSLYMLFLLSTLPAEIVLLVEEVVSAILLQTRAWRLINFLRGILVARLLFGLLSIAIDKSRFPGGLARRSAEVILSTIWLLYFSNSTRVKQVFKTHDWGRPSVLTIQADPAGS